MHPQDQTTYTVQKATKKSSSSSSSSGESLSSSSGEDGTEGRPESCRTVEEWGTGEPAEGAKRGAAARIRRYPEASLWQSADEGVKTAGTFGGNHSRALSWETKPWAKAEDRPDLFYVALLCPDSWY